MTKPKKIRDDKRDRGSPNEFHLVLGAGGSKAILASTGAIAAFELSGWNNWKTIGGISGGSIPASLYANGTRAKEIVWLALNTEFRNLLNPRVGPLRRFWALMRKYHYEAVLPTTGIYSPEPLRRFVDTTVPKWPEKFWTLCTDKNLHQVVLTAEGAFRYVPEVVQGSNLTEKPPCLGTAVSASCAIPGIIDAGEIAGEPMFDGALGHEGNTPILPPQRHYGAEPSKIIALDVGEEDVKKNLLVYCLMRATCLVSRCAPLEAPHPSEEKDGIILIEPIIKRFHGLKFLLDALDKWTAIVAGFKSAIETLERHELISREKAVTAYELYDALSEVSIGKQNRDECAECIEDLFKKFDVL